METMIEQLVLGLEPIIKQAVKECLSQNPPPADPLSDVVTIDVASDRTGKSKSWLYVCWPEIPGAKKHGKRIYFSLAGLALWLNGEKNELSKKI